MARVEMTEILSTLKTQSNNNLGNFNFIMVCTEPLPTPTDMPALFIIPEGSPKPEMDEGIESIWYWHEVSFLVVVSVFSSQEDALMKDTVGLTERMLEVEKQFENNMLSNKLSQVHIEPESYSVPRRDFIDGIYTRAGRLSWTGRTINYESTITR